ncbi:MAG: ATP cone domain-containing protein [bacterium]|nr:ATP cone domain-containing protein [bacterium]
MECPYCHKPYTIVKNSRSTRGNAQIWRRRFCLNCEQTFTTHEVIDLSHLLVIKKSGKTEMFSRMKLYSGIFHASTASRVIHREEVIDKITREIEKEILSLRKKRITSLEIADVVLKVLRRRNTPTFLRFLTYCKDIVNEEQLKRELGRYMQS